MKKLIGRPMLCLLLACAGVLRAQDGPTPYPSPKDGSAWPGEGPVRLFGWMPENRAYFWTQRDQAQGAVVFTGDSLIGNWKQPLLAAGFPGVKVANRGIGGDVSRGLLFRFKEDVLDLNPKAIVICVGTNDLSAHADPAGIARNIGLILGRIRDKNAATPVVLCTVPPRANPKAPLQYAGAVADLNKKIAELAAGQGNVVLFDLFAAFATPEGTPKPQYFGPDLLHPSAAGYAHWASLLSPVLASLKPGTP